MPSRTPSDIAELIVTVRGHRVLLSSELARVYGVPVKALNQAVKRNSERFPSDFAFRLTRSEAEALRRSRSQNVTLKQGANIKYAPLAFTEHGAIMAASVLNSPRAVRMSLFVVRAFVSLKQWIANHRELVSRLAALEARVGAHDEELQAVIRGIRQLMQSDERPRKRIGFGAPGESSTQPEPPSATEGCSAPRSKIGDGVIR